MIEIKGISKSYGRHKVLNNISFSVKPGDCIGIVGANGTGKTTLLSIISGLSKPDSGEILLDGDNILGSSKKSRDNISYVPQENPLISELSAEPVLLLLLSLMLQLPFLFLLPLIKLPLS